MTGFLIFIGVIAVSFFVVAMVTGAIILICRYTDKCQHSYERVDTCNDKNMILVCRRCGKIKKLRK
jgi:hypothetical protein